MNNYRNQFEMENDIMAKPDMSGRKDLGVLRVPANSIPKQSKTPTLISNDKKNAVRGHGMDIAKKMKKVMAAKGMLEKC